MKKQLSAEQRSERLAILKNRFDSNVNRHKDLVWEKVKAKLMLLNSRL